MAKRTAGERDGSGNGPHGPGVLERAGGGDGTGAGPLTLEDLVPDERNRRRRTERSAKLLDQSLGNVGAARSIVIDEHNEIIAGNGVVESAARIGITKVQVVEADGQTVVAVRRTGLTPEQKRELALYDNRTSELAEWNPEQLAADVMSGKPMAPWFEAAELRRLTKPAAGKSKVDTSIVETADVEDRFWIAVEGPLRQQANALERLKTVMKDLTGVTVELGTVPIDQKWG